MHLNFYHWHTHAEFKPEVLILEPRWKAAAKFAEKPSALDIRSLLMLVLFPGAEPEFAKRFSEFLVKLEPTFPPDHNAELLRVMATASVYSCLETPSTFADAFALGIQAAAYPAGRVEPVCQEIIVRAGEYLAEESERVRPQIFVGEPVKAEQQAETQIATLKKVVESNDIQAIGNTTVAISTKVLAALKESRVQFGKAMDRLTEESQFLWWLIGRRSTALNARRESLGSDAYALPAAAEAAERVNLLPPPASVESLLEEVLSQCNQPKRHTVSLEELVDAVNAKWVPRATTAVTSSDLTPLAAILATRRTGAKPNAKYLKQLRIAPKTKIGPAEAAHQYFRELMFLRAMEELG